MTFQQQPQQQPYPQQQMPVQQQQQGGMQPVAPPLNALQQMGVPQVAALPPPIGFSNEPGPEGNCYCCPPSGGFCQCCSFPLFFCDRNKTQVAPRTELKYNPCCGNDVEVTAQLLGTMVHYKYNSPCCPCSQSTVHVTDQGRPVGRVVYNRPCFSCSEYNAQEVYDSVGNLRFTRVQPCCTNNVFYRQDGCCDHFAISWPIRSYASGNQNAGYITYRQHPCCPTCYPWWIGFEQWPVGAQSKDDLLLLTGMTLMRYINLSREKSGGGGGGGH